MIEGKDMAPRLMEYCDDCKGIMDLTVKMGGVICDTCRTTIYRRGSDQHNKAIRLLNEHKL